MLSRSILSNYFWSLLSLFLSKGLRFAGMVICIRLVGNQSWGEAASTIALFSFLTFIIDQGLSGAPLLLHLRNRALDVRLLVLISTYRILMALALIGILFLINRHIHSLGELVLLYSWVLLPRALAIDWWFHRREFYQITMIIGAIRTLVFFSLVAAFIRQGSPPRDIIFIEMAAETVGVALSYAFMRFARSKTGEPAPRLGMRDLLAYSYPFLIIAVLNNVQASMDIVLIKWLCGNEIVAQYDVGIKIGFLYFFLGGTIIQIIRPKLNRLQSEGNLDRMGEILGVTSGILLLLGSLLLLPSFYFSSEVIGFLFNKDNHLAIEVFRWASLWVCITFMTMLCSDTLIALGRRRDYVKAAWMCAVVNILGNVLLLNLFSGYGAIFAKIASEAAFLAVSYSKLSPEVKGKIRRPLSLQLAAISGFVGVYFLSEWMNQRYAGFIATLAGCAGIAIFGKVFTRKTLSVLKEN